MAGARDGANATSELILAIGTLAASGITIALVKYKEHIEKEHLARILEVDKIFKQYLLNIPVKDRNNKPTGETVSFPPPFELDDPDNPTKAKSLQLTSSILDDIDNQIPMYSDPHMAPCVRSLLNALAYFREFHEDRIHERDYQKGHEDDVTSSVICYLILEICVHCIKFEGTARCIAYLDGLTNFVRAYASLHKHSERYERLTLAYGELENAKLLLKDHALKLSHEELICEFLPTCTHLSEMMIKSLTKLGVPKDIWKKVDATTLERLSESVVRPKFKYDHNFHVPFFRVAHATVIKESPVQKWIDDCATKFLLSESITSSTSGINQADFLISSEKYIDKHKRYSAKALAVLKEHQDKKLTSKDIDQIENIRYFSAAEIHALQQKKLTATEFKQFVDEGFFSQKTIDRLNKRGLAEGRFLDSALSRAELDELAHMKLFSKMLVAELKVYKDKVLTVDEIKKLEDERFSEKEMEELRVLFSECENFLTLVPEQKDFKATHTFVPIQDDALIIERTRTYSDYASLITEMIQLQHFGFHLWNRIKELGEIYVSDPVHCNHIFKALIEFGQKVNDSAKAFIAKIDQIKRDNAKARAMLDEDQDRVVNQVMGLLEKITGNITSSINDLTQTHVRRMSDPNADGEIDVEKNKILLLASQLLAACGVPTKYKIKKPPVNVCLPANNALAEMKELNGVMQPPGVVVPANPVPPAPVAGNNLVDQHAGINQEVSLAQLDQALRTVREQVLKLPRGPQKKYCLELYNVYGEVRSHIKKMQDENRNEKAASLRYVMKEICDDTLQFLQENKHPDPVEKKHAADRFAEDVHERLESAPFKELIDEHKSFFNKMLRLAGEIVSCALFFGFINVYKRGGFLQTTTRIEANKIDELAVVIAKSAAPAA
ncbi:MAG: hypothetical protein P4M14_06155 [Gammaproteobacteria bacterium]|nr:hypothetical protein [Gammaproteobacteria bacterium]